MLKMTNQQLFAAHTGAACPARPLAMLMAELSMSVLHGYAREGQTSFIHPVLGVAVVKNAKEYFAF